MRIYFIILFLFVSGCDNATETKKLTADEQAELKNFINKIKSELVYVKGGTFWMGDFCKKMRNDGPYCTSEKDTKPLHEVELTSYSINRFKVTHEDYNYYLTISGLPKQSFNKEWRNEMLADMTFFNRSPAIVTWTEANAYCEWLRTVTGLNFSLPTEAQWEYAARSRGQHILVATDNGIWRSNEKDGRGENYATDEDRQVIEAETGINGPLVHFPVDKYPPNSIGLFGMAENGYEWVLDWYDPDYYSRSPVINPQGPAKPVIKDDDSGQYLKVLRGGNNPDPSGDVGLTFFRGYRIKDNPYPASTTVRCVVNSPDPIK